MPASSSLPLAVLLLAAITLLLSVTCPVATATGNNYYSGGGGGRVLAATAGASPDSRWQQRLEEEVAPEFSSSLLGAGQQYIKYDTLKKNRPACGGGCAARGAAYTNKCVYANRCRG